MQKFLVNPQMIITPGSVVVYNIVVSRNSFETVTVTETVPANTRFNQGASFSGWSCPDDSPAGTICTFELQPFSGPIHFGVAVNNAISPSNAVLTNVVKAGVANEIDLTNSIFTHTAEIDLSRIVATKSAQLVSDTNSNNLADANDEIAYQIVISNTGTGPAKDLVIEDSEYSAAADLVDGTLSTTLGSLIEQSPGWRSDVTSLGAGQMLTISFRVRVRQNIFPEYLASVDNYARISRQVTEFGPPAYITDTNVVTTPLPLAPELRIHKSGFAPNGNGNPGFTNFAINYSNQGSARATNVVITEVLPSYATLDTSNSTPGWLCDSGVCVYNIGTLESLSGNSLRFAISPTISIAPQITQTTNVVQISDDGTHGADKNPANNVFTLTVPFGLRTQLVATKSVSITADVSGVGDLTIGDELEYTVVISNPTMRDAVNIQLEDAMDNVPYNPFPSGYQTVVTNSASISRGTITEMFGPFLKAHIDTVPAGESVTLRFRAKITALPPSSGFVSNQAKLYDAFSYSQFILPVPLTTTNITEVPVRSAIRISAAQSLITEFNRPFVQAGERITLSFAITNTGTQSLPYVSFVSNEAWDYSGFILITDSLRTSPGAGGSATGSYPYTQFSGYTNTLPVGRVFTLTVSGVVTTSSASGLTLRSVGVMVRYNTFELRSFNSISAPISSEIVPTPSPTFTPTTTPTATPQPTSTATPTPTSTSIPAFRPRIHLPLVRK